MLAKKFSAAWLELIPNYALRYDPCRTVTNSTVIVMQTYKLYCFSRSVSLLSLALLFGAWQNAAHRKTPSDLTARKKSGTRTYPHPAFSILHGNVIRFLSEWPGENPPLLPALIWIPPSEQSVARSVPFPAHSAARRPAYARK